jgi:hypothetical protein
MYDACVIAVETLSTNPSALSAMALFVLFIPTTIPCPRYAPILSIILDGECISAFFLATLSIKDIIVFTADIMEGIWERSPLATPPLSALPTL